MASFRLKVEEGLRARAIDVTHDLSQPAQAVLIIGGTRHLVPLWMAKRRGIRTVQRLDGINWVQRVRWSGLRYHLRAEYGNALMALLRSYFADGVIYQSEFIRRWWESWYGPAHVPARVILNGVDLRMFSPKAQEVNLSPKRYRLLVVEGSMAGGLNSGLFNAMRLAEILNTQFPMEMVIAGLVDQRTKKQLQKQSRVPVDFLGTIGREHIPGLARSANLLFSAEVNPPCPNSVIEALACGLPVIGFDTGALKELVKEDAGRIVAYGGDPWKLESPDIHSLAEAAVEILHDQPRFRKAARACAEATLGVDKMVDQYIKVLLD